jgi:hypothetical protein
MLASSQTQAVGPCEKGMRKEERGKRKEERGKRKEERGMHPRATTDPSKPEYVQKPQIIPK